MWKPRKPRLPSFKEVVSKTRTSIPLRLLRAILATSLIVSPLVRDSNVLPWRMIEGETKGAVPVWISEMFGHDTPEEGESKTDRVHVFSGPLAPENKQVLSIYDMFIDGSGRLFTALDGQQQPYRQELVEFNGEAVPMWKIAEVPGPYSWAIISLVPDIDAATIQSDPKTMGRMFVVNGDRVLMKGPFAELIHDPNLLRNGIIISNDAPPPFSIGPVGRYLKEGGGYAILLPPGKGLKVYAEHPNWFSIWVGIPPEGTATSDWDTFSYGVFPEILMQPWARIELIGTPSESDSIKSPEGFSPLDPGTLQGFVIYTSSARRDEVLSDGEIIISYKGMPPTKIKLKDLIGDPRMGGFTHEYYRIINFGYATVGEWVAVYFNIPISLFPGDTLRLEGLSSEEKVRILFEKLKDEPTSREYLQVIRFRSDGRFPEFPVIFCCGKVVGIIHDLEYYPRPESCSVEELISWSLPPMERDWTIHQCKGPKCWKMFVSGEEEMIPQLGMHALAGTRLGPFSMLSQTPWGGVIQRQVTPEVDRARLALVPPMRHQRGLLYCEVPFWPVTGDLSKCFKSKGGVMVLIKTRIPLPQWLIDRLESGEGREIYESYLRLAELYPDAETETLWRALFNQSFYYKVTYSTPEEIKGIVRDWVESKFALGEGEKGLADSDMLYLFSNSKHYPDSVFAYSRMLTPEQRADFLNWLLRFKDSDLERFKEASLDIPSVFYARSLLIAQGWDANRIDNAILEWLRESPKKIVYLMQVSSQDPTVRQKALKSLGELQ